MKDHIIAAVVNDLRDTAIKFHNTQQLRERLRGCIEPLLSAAAPQVVADERGQLTDEELADPEYMRGYVEGCNESFNEAMKEIARLRAALQAAPVQAQELSDATIINAANKYGISPHAAMPFVRELIAAQSTTQEIRAVANPVEFDGIKTDAVQAQEPVTREKTKNPFPEGSPNENWRRGYEGVRHFAPPVAADAEPIEVMRANFEDWYTTHAADIKAAPIGSRDSMLQWSSWIAARSGNYVARGGWQISPRPWGPAGAPVAVGSVDALVSWSYSPTLHVMVPDSPKGQNRQQYYEREDVIAWGTQQHEAGYHEGVEQLRHERDSLLLLVTEAQDRAEKAEAERYENHRLAMQYKREADNLWKRINNTDS